MDCHQQPKSAAFRGIALRAAVFAIVAEDQSVLREFGNSGGMDAVRFAYKFEKAGTYYVRLSDYQQSGKASNFYRVKIGNFPLVERAYPLGMEAGKSREIAFTGWNLSPSKLNVDGKPSDGSEDMLRLRPNHAFNEVRLAVGQEPEVDAAGTRDR